MNKKSERQQNLILVIETLRRFGSMTQARLKEYCNIQASTVSYLVNDLKTYNLIKDLGQVEQNGKVGKPGNMILLNNDMAQFLGIYVEDDCLYAYLIGVDGSTLESDSVEFTGASVEEEIFSIIRSNLALHPQIKGVGLTIKAIVYNDGSIKSGERHHAGESWNFAGLPDKLKEAFPGILIIIENDANSAAELYHYENKLEKGNLVVYLFNRAPFGIGCGLMIHGDIFRGSSGAAGEFFEKDSKIREISKSIHDERDFISKFIPAVLPHILETAYFLDPECIVVTGSYFDNLMPESIETINELFKRVHIPVLVASGEARLNPAKGVAILTINSYITNFVKEVVKR